MYRRYLEQNIAEALKDTPVIAIIGPRQSGKSTLLLEIAQNQKIPYRTLDDATVLSAASSDPAGFLRGLEPRAAIDEAQRVPELALAIKASVDLNRSPGRYIVSGSSNILTLPVLSDSLAGRMEVLSLFPLSQSEIANVRPDLIHALFEGSPLSFPNLGPESRSEIIKRVLVGGFPEVLGRESEKRRTQWFNSYISTVIQRDVRDIAQIAELADLPRLLVTLAQRVGSLLNSAELSRTTGIPYTTLLRYLDILTAIFMYQPLPAWSTNLGKRLVKAPKIHLVDSGVAGALRGLDEKSALKFPDRFGPLFENFVISEIRKLRSWSDLDFEMYHYRSSGGAEVDCVLESRRGDIVGIEVKATSSVKSSDFRGLKSLREDSPGQFRRGVVIYDGYEVVAFDEDLLAVPVGALWSNFKI